MIKDTPIKNRIKVLYISRAPFISGAERCLQQIIKNADNHDIEPILATPKSSPLKIWAEENQIKHVNLETDPTKLGKVLWIYNLIKLPIICLKYRVKVIHSNQVWSTPVTSIARRALRVKVVCHFRDPINNGTKWWLKSKVDHGISISGHIYNQAIKHLLEKSFSHHEIIDPIPFAENFSPIDSNDPKLKMGYIGQLRDIKGVYELIQACSKIKGQNWILIIAGKDNDPGRAYLRKCEGLVSDLGLTNKIRFVGFLSNPSELYNQVDLLLVPSKEEPLGLIPLEAGMHERPSIAMNVGGLPDTIENNTTGWLVNNTSEMISKATEIPKFEIVNAGRSARKRVIQMCSVDVHLNKLRKIYSE